MKYTLILMLIVVGHASAQQHGMTYYDVFKKFKYEDYYVDMDGRMDGKYTAYFIDGTIAVTRTYVHGTVEGREVEYWKEDHFRGISYVSNYKHGIKEGLQQEYLDPVSGEYDNYVRREIFYVDGVAIWRKTYERVEGGKICLTIKETWENHIYKKRYLLCDGSPCTAYEDVTEPY